MLIMKDARILDMTGAIGQNIGFAVHADQTVKALKRHGVTFTDKECNVVFHQCPGHLFRPIEGKLNILFTAYEAPDLAPEYIETGEKADLIICTSSFTAKAYKQALPRKHIAKCPLGVDINLFTYKKRKIPKNSPFVFLWVGAPNERKGWRIIKEAWKQFQFDEDKVLLIKTSKKDGKLERRDNVVIDTRKVETEDLVRIYHFANCFLFPSYAEGFGLPLIEAMSTGLPCIFTPWGGVTDFADKKVGFPLNYKVIPVDYGVRTTAAAANPGDLVVKMGEVYNNYKRAVNKGKEARRRVETRFTWDDTARKLKKIISHFLKTGEVKQWV